MNSTIDPIRLEKTAVFDVSLKLLREGKFHATPLDEIAYMAKISGNLMDWVFQSRENLLAELSEVTIVKLENEIENVVRKSDTFKDRVFATWSTFYEFYTRYPDMIAFVEQFDSVQKMVPGGKITYPGKFRAIVHLFEGNDAHENQATPETLAWLLHENALSASKMNTLNKSLSDPGILAEFFWQGLYGK